MDAAERKLLEEAVGAALGVDGAGADDQLASLGWLEMLAAEQRNAIAVVFEALGATNRAATSLDDVVASALGVEPRPDLAVLLPQFGAWSAPGVITDGRARADGLATARVTTARELLVVCRDGPKTRTVTVPASAIEAHAVRGVDPDSCFHIVTLDDAAAVGEALDGASWEAGVGLGRRAVAHQILGASRTMLSLARDYALERVQFDRAIASFQAVRHRLAEVLVAVESLDATLGAAADEPGPVTAALAKATAGRTARTVAAHSQQVLAGIGFTTDHPFHRFLKRTMFLEGLFGSADDIALDLGRQLLAARKVPTLIEL
jgi:Acyl-CoA dehydrogenase, C-terminal domain